MDMWQMVAPIVTEVHEDKNSVKHTDGRHELTSPSIEVAHSIAESRSVPLNCSAYLGNTTKKSVYPFIPIREGGFVSDRRRRVFSARHFRSRHDLLFPKTDSVWQSRRAVSPIGKPPIANPHKKPPHPFAEMRRFDRGYAVGGLPNGESTLRPSAVILKPASSSNNADSR